MADIEVVKREGQQQASDGSCQAGGAAKQEADV